MLEVKNIQFGYTKNRKVLNNFSYSFTFGNIYALIGANGAGKSTLAKIISGELFPQTGDITINNKHIVISSPKDAIKSGIVRVSQEFNLIENLTVADNIYITDQTTNPRIFYNRKRSISFAKEALESINIDIDVTKKISKIKLSQHPFISIAKSLIHKPEILILDETTAVLNESEIDNLFKKINKLKNNGIVIFVTHKLEEVIKYADKAIVLRNGKLVLDKQVDSVNPEILTKAMLGDKKIKTLSPTNTKKDTLPLLRVKNFSSPNLCNISFDINQGETLGIISKSISALDEIVNAIYGINPNYDGKIIKGETPLNLKSPKDAIENNIGYITDDKKIGGLFYNMTVADNINFLNLQKHTFMGFLNRKQLYHDGINKVKEFEIVSDSLNQNIAELSGGNQQKVLFSKWFSNNFDLLILNEPTAGIDIKGKYEVYNRINELKNKGKSFLLISSEWNEIKTICDRVIVLSNGAVINHFEKNSFDEHEIFSKII